MAYTPYVTADEYVNNMGFEAFDGLDKALVVASRHIDTLTFNRILGMGGFDKLTEFQQGIIKEVTASQTKFEHDNADAINSILTGYSINGVSAQFGDGMGVETLGGITISKANYSLLEQTGLCCRLAVYPWRNIQS